MNWYLDDGGSTLQLERASHVTVSTRRREPEFCSQASYVSGFPTGSVFCLTTVWRCAVIGWKSQCWTHCHSPRSTLLLQAHTQQSTP